MTNTELPPATRGLLLSVALISAATLAVQVLQTRLFSAMEGKPKGSPGPFESRGGW